MSMRNLVVVALALAMSCLSVACVEPQVGSETHWSCSGDAECADLGPEATCRQGACDLVGEDCLTLEDDDGDGATGCDDVDCKEGGFCGSGEPAETDELCPGGKCP